MRAPKEITVVRQEQIAEAAMQLIAAHGLAGLSIAAIAQQVGIVPSAVYRHFPGKEAVLDAVLDLLQARMKQNVEIVCAESDSALERLHSLLTRHLTMLVENRAFPYLIFSHLSEADHSERRKRLESTMHGFLAQIAAIVRQGQQKGEIRSDLSPKTVAVMFVGMVLPAAVLFRLSGGKFDPIDHLNQAWPPFVRGITEDE
jgi:AcrR family transcriptional regulator